MARSILSASLVRPAWQLGSFRVEGPDEDSFTLAVTALNRLGRQLQGTGARTLARLHVVGSCSPEIDWAFSEALGIPGLDVRRYPSNAPGLWGALAAAAHDDGTAGREAVVAADTATLSPEAAGDRRVRHSAGGVAFLLSKELGLSVLRHGFRGHPPGHSPSMQGAITGWLEALGLSPHGSRGEVVFEVEEEPDRWQAAWEQAAPGITVTVVGGPRVDVGRPSAVEAALLLWELARRLRTGDTGVVGQAVRGRNGFSAFRLDGPVRWLGSWGTGEPGLNPPTDKFLIRKSQLDAVSQGAYLPHPTYLENLAGRWRLVGERCPRCDTLAFPARGRCRSCGRSEGLRSEALPRVGLEVEAVTTISPGAQPTEFDSMVETVGAYDVAVVRLQPGVRATFQVTDAVAGRLRVGDRVAAVLRRLYPMEGEWRYGLKAIPETPGSTPRLGERDPKSPARSARRGSSSVAPRERRATPRGSGGRAERRPQRPR
ncbi:MAG: zinc ribbon domain-containing protein [Thermoplasmata archaeon]|nr:zinc ribbon domain-containing protein [Thermoplasmata archaeon]